MSRAVITFFYLSFLFVPIATSQVVSSVLDVQAKEPLVYPEPNAKPIYHNVVINQSSHALVAFRAVFTCPHVEGRKPTWTTVDHDPLVNYGGQRPIAAGGNLSYTSPDPHDCSGGIVAAIFDDGHVEGNAEAIGVLFGKRRGALAAVEKSIRILDAVASGEKSAAAAKAELYKHADDLSYDESIDVSERQGMIRVYNHLSILLTDLNRALRAPSDAGSQPKSYASVAAEKNVSLEQAQAMEFVKRLAEWKRDLDGRTAPAGKP